MIVHDIAQRSAEWQALRLGRVCGSHAAQMLATVQKGEAAGRRNLRAQLVLERLTGKPQERNFQSQAMTDGIEREDGALAKYEELSGRLTRIVGFVSHPTLMVGFSPDAAVGEFEGLVEAKCPIPATHLDYIESGKVPGDYMKQITHGLWVTGAAWCDFISFQPDFPEEMRLRLVRVHRADVDLKDYEAKLRTFLAEVDQKIATLKTLTNLTGTLAAAVGA